MSAAPLGTPYGAPGEDLASSTERTATAARVAAAMAVSSARTAAVASASSAQAGSPGWRRVVEVAAARALLTLVASLFLWSALPMAVGWTPRVILSGSMEPRIHVGDVVVTRPVPVADVTKGQVVTVDDPDHPGRTRTHRVQGRAADGRLVLKGDANRQADSTHVGLDHVLGVGVLRVPYVGRPAYWLAEGNWPALGATALVLGWCVVTVLPSSRRSPRRDDAGPPRRPRPRRRRMVAAAAVAAVAVGTSSGPADAAFRLAVGNPVSTLRAATNFWDYRTEVLGDSPYLYWRLDETSGTTVADASGGGRAGTLAGTVTRGVTGALTSESPNRAITFATGSVSTGTAVTAPATFSVEAWIRTTSSTGGSILGFSDKSGFTSTPTIDRELYLGANGKAYFGVGSGRTVVASTTAVNNGSWHHLVGTYASGAGGMKLYVDGVLQGSATATASNLTGYWKAARERLSGWTSNPTDDYFDGTLDEVAVYGGVLTPDEIASHFSNATG